MGGVVRLAVDKEQDRLRPVIMVEATHFHAGWNLYARVDELVGDLPDAKAPLGPSTGETGAAQPRLPSTAWTRFQAFGPCPPRSSSPRSACECRSSQPLPTSSRGPSYRHARCSPGTAAARAGPARATPARSGTPRSMRRRVPSIAHEGLRSVILCCGVPNGWRTIVSGLPAKFPDYAPRQYLGLPRAIGTLRQ